MMAKEPPILTNDEFEKEYCPWYTPWTYCNIGRLSEYE